MKSLIFTPLILFLAFYTVYGQRNEPGSENPRQKYRIYIRPEIKDSIHLRLDSLTQGTDSLKILGYTDRRQLHGNPFLRPRHFNDDNMVYNPGPSYDRMPNADVTTPGVHYTLKIKKIGQPFGNYPIPNRPYPPYLRR